MKKISLIALAALMCLLACAALAESGHDHEMVPQKYDNFYHHLVCVICGEASDHMERHAVSCSSPNHEVCPACGASAQEGAVILIVHDWEDRLDDESTWRQCRSCGAIDPASVHYHEWQVSVYPYDHRIDCKVCGYIKTWENHAARCTHRDACEICGAKVSDGAYIEFIDHVGKETAYYDETCHWTACSACGEIFNGRDYHTAYCHNPDICSSCGRSTSGDGVEMAAVYHGSFQTAFDATHHWHVCELCGEISYRAVHTAPCYMKTICSECGARVEYDGIVIKEFIHPSYITEPFGNGHRMVCQHCGEVFDQGPHVAYCIAPHECAYCGVSFEGEPLHQKSPLACQPADAECHTFVCDWCGKTVREAHRFEGDRCTECKYVRPAATEAPVSEPTPTAAPASQTAWRKNQTVCSLGLRFRDVMPQLTRKWFMFTPLDLSQAGEQTFPLVSANAFVVGQVTVTVREGTVQVIYNADKHVIIRDMRFTLLPDAKDLTHTDILQMKTYAFGQEISIRDELGGDELVLLYVLGHADYDAQDERLRHFSDSAAPYKTLLETMKQRWTE